MRRRLLFAAVTLLAVGSAGCAPAFLSAGAHVQRDIDFSQYRTYDWARPDALPESDARLDANPFFRDRFYGEVEKGLAVRGLTLATENPDLLIHYHASASHRFAIDRHPTPYPCRAPSCAEDVMMVEDGTLVLDVVDRRTNQVIWRGWTRHDLGDLLQGPDGMRSQVTHAVERMLARFPVRVSVGRLDVKEEVQ